MSDTEQWRPLTLADKPRMVKGLTYQLSIIENHGAEFAHEKCLAAADPMMSQRDFAEPIQDRCPEV